MARGNIRTGTDRSWTRSYLFRGMEVVAFGDAFSLVKKEKRLELGRAPGRAGRDFE